MVLVTSAGMLGLELQEGEDENLPWFMSANHVSASKVIFQNVFPHSGVSEECSFNLCRNNQISLHFLKRLFSYWVLQRNCMCFV